MPDIKYAIIDCRVSDRQQLKGGSLDDQEAIGRLKAAALGAEVVKVFRNPHSATTTVREDLEEKISFIKDSHKKISYYIFKCIDRFTRAGFSEYEKLKAALEKIGVELIDSYGVIQPKQNTLAHLGQSYRWSVYSPSESAEMLAAYQGKQEVRDILTRLIGAEIRLVQEGYAVRRAPDGFHNKTLIIEGRKKTIREPSERAHFFVAMFELRAQGVPDLEIVNRLNNMGFRTRVWHRWDKTNKEIPELKGQRGGNLITVKQLQRYMIQTEYAGVLYEKWTKESPIKAQWEGLVSIDTFNRANKGNIYIDEAKYGSIKIYHNYTPTAIKRRKDNPLFPWKFILCPTCRKPLFGSASKSRSGQKHPYYHCGGDIRSTRQHAYFRIPKKEFEKNILEYFKSIAVDSSYIFALREQLIETYHKNVPLLKEETDKQKKHIADMKAVMEKKIEAFAFAESDIVRKVLERQIESLQVEIHTVESDHKEFVFNEATISAFFISAADLLEHPEKKLAMIEEFEKRRAAVAIIFDEIPSYSEIVTRTAKPSFFYKDFQLFKHDKSQWVHSLSLNANLIASAMAQWIEKAKEIGLTPDPDKPP